MLDIDYSYIVGLLPDVSRRKPTRLDWLYLNISSIKKAYDNFKLDFADYKFLASHTSQTLSITHLLNILVGNVNEIYITDGIWLPETYIYKSNEYFQLKQTYIYKGSEALDETYIYSNSEFENDQIDFVVNVSVVDVALESTIRYYINLYKQGGTSYTISYY